VCVCVCVDGDVGHYPFSSPWGKQERGGGMDGWGKSWRIGGGSQGRRIR